MKKIKYMLFIFIVFLVFFLMGYLIFTFNIASVE